MAENSFDTDAPPVASWRHTALVLAVLAAGSTASAIEHGMPNAHLPWLDTRLSTYITALGEEWLLALLVWLALRRRGLRIGFLVAGGWGSAGRFCKDLGLGVGFTVLTVLLTNSLMYLIGGSGAGLDEIMPKNLGELAVWLALAASAGFCEELTFRGYLMHQFRAWTGSRLWGVLLQGSMFGLAHGYYGRGMAVIMVHGCLLGAMAQWRRSLRPGMLSHGLEDCMGGVAGFFVH